MEGGASSAGANWAQLTVVQPQQQHIDQLSLKVKVGTQPQQQQQQHTLQQQQRKWQQQPQQQQQQKVQQQQLQQQQEAISLFNRWVKAGFRPKLTLDLRPGGMFISLLCRPAAATAKKRPAKRANAKRLEKQRARRASRQREQQAVAAAAVSAAAPAAITPSGELQQPFLAAGAAPATVAASATATAATAAPLPPAATVAPQPAATVASPARSRAILSLKNSVRRETRSVSKKRKVETPSDSEPATPEGGSFTLLSQLDGAAQSPTPPTPEPAPPDLKQPPPDDGDWFTVKPPRRNPR